MRDHGNDLLLLRDLQQSEVTNLPVTSLRGTVSPRLAGANEGHARALAEMDELPPILVDRQTMRIIDGVHRVRAAVLRGQTTINAIFAEGHADDLFLLAVTLNTRHGLPLSLADRKAAALRIVSSRPDWSDHAIADAAGLAATTIAGIRRQCSTGASVQSNTRLGRDGRVRPVDGTEGRRRATAEVLAHPGASIREVAQAAGVSLGTAHDVTRLVHGNPGSAAAPRHRPGSP
ncbi:MAG: ParB N-terminal domain-containing protein, partial [Actinomycetota bacterium]|nr:ParB N-terminal domain-containing protein [Actinomycetota bacterium]